jgi:4-hydroxy-3-polyprenylbenzoate decarboxylase
MKIVVAITGASGIIYAIRLLELLKKLSIETHLVFSKWAIANLDTETNYSIQELEGLATKVYDNNNLAAAISSGSFKVDGMVIVPCSMKTLAAISHGFSENLIQRAADVAMKEHRKLILVPRETPLNAIHLENMLKLSRLGVIIMPPMPGLYNRPQSLDDIINYHAGRILDQLGIEHNFIKRWQ